MARTSDTNQTETDDRAHGHTGDNLPAESQNPIKDPADWTTGGEPMTGPQASYLSTLLQQAGKSDADLDPNLTKADASKLIDQLQEETGRGKGNPSGGQ